MMMRMSFSETIFLFLLALIIFGPKKLPDIARKAGKIMNDFKRASNEFRAQIEQEISNLEVDKRQTILPPSPPMEGTTSRGTNTLAIEPASAEIAAPERPLLTSESAEDEPLFATSASAVAKDEAISTQASGEKVVTSSQESHG